MLSTPRKVIEELSKLSEDQKDMIIVVSYSFTNEAQEKELEDKSFNEAAEKGLFKP